MACAVPDSGSNVAKAFKHFSFYETGHPLSDLLGGESKNVFAKEYAKAMCHVACSLDIF